jgi:hypothetical protein
VWPDRVTDRLSEPGLATHAGVRREPQGREKTGQAYLLARKVS